MLALLPLALVAFVEALVLKLALALALLFVVVLPEALVGCALELGRSLTRRKGQRCREECLFKVRVLNDFEKSFTQSRFTTVDKFEGFTSKSVLILQNQGPIGLD